MGATFVQGHFAQQSQPPIHLAALDELKRSFTPGPQSGSDLNAPLLKQISLGLSLPLHHLGIQRYRLKDWIALLGQNRTPLASVPNGIHGVGFPRAGQPAD